MTKKLRSHGMSIDPTNKLSADDWEEVGDRLRKVGHLVQEVANLVTVIQGSMTEGSARSKIAGAISSLEQITAYIDRKDGLLE